MKIKLGKIEQGICPYCGSAIIYYGVSEHYDDMIMHPAHCAICHRDFEEWYDLKFVGHNVGNDLNIEAEEDMEIEMED